MQLPDFIKRALSFFEKAEEQFKAAETSKNKISELEQANAELTKDLAEVQGLLKKANADLAAKDGEVAKLKGEINKEQARANATIASQGLPVERVPASAPNAGNEQKENAWQKYQRLLAENSRAAGQFWAEKADEIMRSRFDK